MKNVLAFILSLLLLSDVSGQEDAYTKTINTRAQKIVVGLSLSDSLKATKVQSIVAQHYRNLNDIHSRRDAQIKNIKSKGEAKEVMDASTKKAEDDASVNIKKIHRDFITSLSSELTDDQIVKVKDGLTYNVVNITYTGYLDMLPNLTEEQKKQIRTWLEEAREYAMNAESSDKKHAWFGKYKGRINNYLSAAGYDLKKEGDAWQKRIKEREEKKKAAAN